jgi:hypothetical protein
MDNEKQDIGIKIREKLLAGDFDFGKKQYEPTVCEPIDTHAPIRPRLIRYLKGQYGSSGKLDHHDESLNRILGLGRETLHALQEQDESETAKVYTLCSTLSAARKNWAPLLSDQDKGFISDFPLPQPEDDCHVLPELGKHQAMNTAQSRYFFHALLAGMPPSERERYSRLYAKEWGQFLQPASRLSNGMDAVVLQIELALQRAFGHFLSKVPGFDDAAYLPDHGATGAVEQTLALVDHLLPRSSEPQKDLLRAALIKNGAIHVATNQINGILRAYDEVAKALPPELERCRGITVASHVDIAPTLTALLDVPTPELPDDLVMMAEIVCRMYCAQVGPANPADHAAFIRLHNSPLQITVSAILIYDDWRSKREVDKSIRGEKNSQRQIFRQLHSHYLEHKDEVDRGDMIISEITLGEMHFLTARYSIAAFALASDYPVREGALAHLSVKRMKYVLQRSVCMKLLGLSVADAVRFADSLNYEVKQRMQRSRSRTFPTFTLSGTTVQWEQRGW